MESSHRIMVCQALSQHKKCTVKVEGTSMWPFIKPGDRVTIKNNFAKPIVGSVVAFFIENQLVIHRVIWFIRRGPKTWNVFVHGDSSPFSFSEIKSGIIIGTVKQLKRSNKTYNLWLSNPFGIFAIPLGFLFQCMVLLRLFLKKLIPFHASQL